MKNFNKLPLCDYVVNLLETEKCIMTSCITTAIIILSSPGYVLGRKQITDFKTTNNNEVVDFMVIPFFHVFDQNKPETTTVLFKLVINVILAYCRSLILTVARIREQNSEAPYLAGLLFRHQASFPHGITTS